MKPLLLILLLFLVAAQTLTAQHHTRKHKPKLFRSVDVEYWNTTDSIILGGTLTLPNQRGKRFPAVILISGSGAQDRDYTAFKNYKMFKEIAEYLSARGIAVLRVDDRGAGKTGFKGPGYFNLNSPKRASLNPVISDLSRDVLTGITFLKKISEIDTAKIGLLGHSFGGIVAPVVSTSVTTAFIVSLAGPVITGKQFAVDQWRGIYLTDNIDTLTVNDFQRYFFEPMFDLVISNPTDEKLSKKIEEIICETRTHLDSSRLAKFNFQKYSDSDLAVIIRSNVRLPSVNEILSFDPGTVWRQVRCPVLAVFAAKDKTVNPLPQIDALYQLFDQGKLSCYEVVIFSGLNHVFRNSITGSASEDKLNQEGISVKVLRLIYGWINTICMSKPDSACYLVDSRLSVKR